MEDLYGVLTTFSTCIMLRCQQHDSLQHLIYFTSMNHLIADIPIALRSKHLGGKERRGKIGEGYVHLYP